MNEVQLAEIERRLDNWGAWARSHGGGNGGCASAERRYVCPRDDEGDRLVMEAREPIQIGDAEVLEAAVLRVQRRTDRQLLVMVYVDRMAAVSIAAEFNIPVRLVRPHTIRVAFAVQYHLDHDKNLVLSIRRQRRALHSTLQSNNHRALTNDVTGA